jgi:hypothetical protein
MEGVKAIIGMSLIFLVGIGHVQCKYVCLYGPHSCGVRPAVSQAADIDTAGEGCLFESSFISSFYTRMTLAPSNFALESLLDRALQRMKYASILFTDNESLLTEILNFKAFGVSNIILHWTRLLRKFCVTKVLSASG